LNESRLVLWGVVLPCRGCPTAWSVWGAAIFLAIRYCGGTDLGATAFEELQ